jgi:hypothetical protein
MPADVKARLVCSTLEESDDKNSIFIAPTTSSDGFDSATRAAAEGTPRENPVSVLVQRVCRTSLIGQSDPARVQ